MRKIFENGKCLNDEFVLITAYGQYYHDDPECSNLGIPENNQEVKLIDAITAYSPCPLCCE